jgi:peptide/nickel transport system permease protein
MKLAGARAAEAKAEARIARERRRTKRLARWRPTPAALIGLSIVASVALVAIAADLITPSPPDLQRLPARLDAPSWTGGTQGFLLGSDHLGRDILSRAIHGARVSLVVGFAGVALSGGVGVTLGLIAGYLGGWWDRVIMRIADVQQAIPALVLAIAVVAMLRPSLVNLIVVLAVTTWVGFARIVRSEVLAVRESLLVEAARVIGATDARIIARHILPNVAASIIVIASLMVANMILFEASLSFLGLGVPPTVPSWGRMVFEGIEYVDTAWWVPVFPGLAVMATVLGINLAGDWLRDALDPRLRMR